MKGYYRRRRSSSYNVKPPSRRLPDALLLERPDWDVRPLWHTRFFSSQAINNPHHTGNVYQIANNVLRMHIRPPPELVLDALKRNLMSLGLLPDSKKTGEATCNRTINTHNCVLTLISAPFHAVHNRPALTYRGSRYR